MKTFKAFCEQVARVPASIRTQQRLDQKLFALSRRQRTLEQNRLRTQIQRDRSELTTLNTQMY